MVVLLANKMCLGLVYLYSDHLELSVDGYVYVEECHVINVSNSSTRLAYYIAMTVTTNPAFVQNH